MQAGQGFLSEEKNWPKWGLSKKGSFSEKLWYCHLTRADKDNVIFLHKQIWTSKVPPRISNFAREACRGCILTVDDLKRRVQHLVNRCYMCKMAEENCYHLLIGCPVVSDQWYSVFRFLGLRWIIPGLIREELLAWKAMENSYLCNEMVPLTILWTV